MAIGRGLAAMYRELGAHVVDGGATMNPSTYDLLAGDPRAPAAEAIVLPNSPNVILAAERAAELSEKPARVVPTRAQQEGLLALLAFDPSHGAEENAEAVAAAAGGAHAPAASRRRAKDDVRAASRGRRGRLRGRRAGRLGRPAATLAAVLRQVGEDAEVVT